MSSTNESPREISKQPLSSENSSFSFRPNLTIPAFEDSKDGLRYSDISPLSDGLISHNSTFSESPKGTKKSPSSKQKVGQDPYSSVREIMTALAAKHAKGNTQTNTKRNTQQPQNQSEQYEKTNTTNTTNANYTSITSTHETNARKEHKPTTRGRFHPLSMTLNVLNGLGTVTEKLLQITCGNPFDDDSSRYSRERREREDLIDDIKRIDKLNSFDTYGTVSTNDTQSTFRYPSEETNESGPSTSNTTVDDDGNVIPMAVIKEHMLRKQIADKLSEQTSIGSAKKTKTKEKRRQKLVGFEYPPISTMKQVPRINSLERKELFFGKDELDKFSEYCSSESDYDDENTNSSACEVMIVKEKVHDKNVLTSPTLSPMRSPKSPALRKGKFSTSSPRSSQSPKSPNFAFRDKQNS